MAKTKCTIYSCDKCGKEFKVEQQGFDAPIPKDLKTVVVPGRSYDCEGRTWTMSGVSIDLCSEDHEKLFELIESQFAVIEDGPGGLVVTKPTSKRNDV